LRLLRVRVAGVQFIGRKAKPRQRANMGKCGRLAGIITTGASVHLQRRCNTFGRANDGTHAQKVYLCTDKIKTTK
jgi:hypothetical protein